MTRREHKAWECERRALALRMLDELGGTPEARRQVARVFDVTERSVRRWAARRQAGLPLVERRGRPPDAVPRERRQRVIRALLRLGPCAGVAVLRGLFPDVAYRTLAKMKRRFARVLQRRLGWYRRRLKWLRAGAIWALDFTRPKAKLGGGNGHLLHVRDLASGAELLVMPCRGERSITVQVALGVLFLALGAPLLIKMDNGKAFRARATTTLLCEHGVVALYSPTYTPSYNGSCERGGGSLKERIAHQAYLRGDPARWIDTELVAAQHQANTMARPWGATGPTPAEHFRARRPIEPVEREAFQRTCDAEIANMVETHKEQSCRMPTCSERADIERIAAQRALCKHGYLEFRRGRLSTPIQVWRAVTKT